MVEHHSSKMSILVRIQKRMYDLKLIAFIVTVFKNIVKKIFCLRANISEIDRVEAF